MQEFWRFLFPGLLALGLASAAGCAGPGAGGKPILFEATGEAVLEQAGSVAAEQWGPGVRATGKGLPAADAETPALKMLTARQAARYRALAALVEKVEGTRVSRESRVLNLQFAGEVLEAHTDGRLPGAVEVDSRWDEAEQYAELTLMVRLDSAGRPLPAMLAGAAPESLAARRVRAEHAARLQALAQLRQKVGELTVGQQVRVENLVLSHQEAWSAVEGMLAGVEFDPPRWPSEEHCVVRARLALNESELAELRRMADAPG